MRLKVNGEFHSFESSPTPPCLLNIIKLLGHNPSLIVVEFNGEIISPKLWEGQMVKDGDVIEIVTIVGGGS